MFVTQLDRMDRCICNKCNQIAKQYSCVKCSQNYSTKSNLNRHIKNAHKVEKSNIVDNIKNDYYNEEMNTKIQIILKLLNLTFVYLYIYKCILIINHFI